MFHYTLSLLNLYEQSITQREIILKEVKAERGSGFSISKKVRSDPGYLFRRQFGVGSLRIACRHSYPCR